MDEEVILNYIAKLTEFKDEAMEENIIHLNYIIIQYYKICQALSNVQTY